MPLTFRDTKGSNLTPEEVDANFRQLVEDINAIETPEPVGISNIIVTGTSMIVVLSDETELGPYDLPQAPFRPTITETLATSTHDLVAANANRYLRCTNVAGCVVSVLPDADELVPLDSEISFRQCAAGPVGFVAGDGVTINVLTGFIPATPLVGAVVTLKKVGANEWDLFGLLAEDVS